MFAALKKLTGWGEGGGEVNLLCFLQAVEVLGEVLQEPHRRVSMHEQGQPERGRIAGWWRRTAVLSILPLLRTLNKA